MNEGLVAPTWSDSGEVPVGEVTYTYDFEKGWTAGPPILLAHSITSAIGRWDGSTLEAIFGQQSKPSDPNAKPSLPSLSRVSGEAYRGLGWCDE